MSHFLQYWTSYKPSEDRSDPLLYSASNQFKRLDVTVGDTLWIITLIHKRLTLVGRLEIDSLINAKTAKRRFGADIYDRETYAIPSQPERLSKIDINDIAQKLRFQSDVDRLPVVDGPNIALGRHLQALRRLTPESVELLRIALASPNDAHSRVEKSWVDDLCTVLTALGGVGALKDIYAKAEELRTSVPHSSIRRTLQMNSSDSSVWHGGLDVFYSVEGIGKGVWGLRSSLLSGPTASDVDQAETTDEDIPVGNTSPKRMPVEIARIVRDGVLCRRLKLLHRNSCQLCGHAIKLPNGLLYSEAHHIRPLGSPHHGKDTAENIIIVCPNHHAELDFACRSLEMHLIRLHARHSISRASLDYHNALYAAKKQAMKR